jgi:hypothetical protein
MDSIYEKDSCGVVYSPFNLKIEGMKHLFLISFEKDPDEVYVGFEPQLFDDPVMGKGLRVIAWRKDGYVDVYQQRTLTLNENFDVAGKGLADLLQRDMEGARFNITEMGVDVYFAFEDKEGRHVEVVIKENSNKPTSPFDLLAPVGHSSENPTALPLFFLYDFYFVRRSNTQVQIKINGVIHKADKFPMPMDGSRIYFMRYSRDPFLVNFNNAQNGPLASLIVNNETFTDSQGTQYEMINQNGHYEISRISGGNDKYQINIGFNPPIPDIVCLKDKTTLEGRFSISLDERVGSLSGEYYISKDGSGVEMRMTPSDGWKPGKCRFMVGLIFKMGAIFKNWPKSYVWTARIKLKEDEAPMMESKWSRIGKGKSVEESK